MTEVIYIKQNDLQPHYNFQIVDHAKAPVNLTGSTIVCTMKESTTGTVKVNRQSCVIDDAVNGKGHYAWQANDTDTVGSYWIEFEVTPAVGGKFTVPSSPREAARVEVVAQLDAV